MYQILIPEINQIEVIRILHTRTPCQSIAQPVPNVNHVHVTIRYAITNSARKDVDHLENDNRVSAMAQVCEPSRSETILRISKEEGLPLVSKSARWSTPTTTHAASTEGRENQVRDVDAR